MEGKQKFYVCKICGNLIGFVDNKGVPLKCCGENMAELAPNSVEASREKHLPVVEVFGDVAEVSVGSVPHPMEDGHYIGFVFVETVKGGQRKRLTAGEAPKVKFRFADDRPLKVYAWCNQHGLWVTEV